MIDRSDLLSGTRPELNGRILLTLENHFQGYEIIDYRGMVWGISMRSKDMGQDFLMSCKQMTGGELTSYTALADEGRQRAIDRMVSMAKRRQANAIINFRFEQSFNIYNNSAEVTAFGNAVVIKPIKNYVPTGGLGNILVEFYEAYTKLNSNKSEQNINKQVNTPIPEGAIVRKDNLIKVKCPYCGMLYDTEIKDSKTIIIPKLGDENADVSGQQIKCSECMNIFTVPHSEGM